MDKDNKLMEEYSNNINLLIYEGNLIWKKVYSLLFITIILVTISATLIGTKVVYPYLTTISFLGLFLTVIFSMIIQRGWCYHRHWIDRIEQIEKEIPELKTFKRCAPEGFSAKSLVKVLLVILIIGWLFSFICFLYAWIVP